MIGETWQTGKKTYSQAMGEQRSFLTLKIETDEPVELRDFVGAFTSLANEFERYVAATYPDVMAEPRMFVREVRRGSIEADMTTGLMVVAITHMDQILILEDFVRRWGRRFTALRDSARADGEVYSRSELKDWADAARSIASDPIAAHRLVAATFEDGKRDIRAEFMFTAPEARAALQNIEDRTRQLTKSDNIIHRRVLMTYTRPDIHDAKLNKKSGERALIRDVSEMDKPVMYATEMAEQEIREVFRQGDDNIFKTGFVVDVSAQMDGDRLVAYSVMNLHSVIDIDD